MSDKQTDSIEEKRQELIKILSDKFGAFDESSNGFDDIEGKNIAKFLGYSAGHFSGLLNGSKTIGTYTRAISNARKLIEYESMKNTREKDVKIREEEDNNRTRRLILLLTLSALLFGAIGYFFSGKDTTHQSDNTTNSLDIIDFLDTSHSDISPYVKEKEKYNPSSIFQGKWKLKKSYTIPLTKKGYYYRGTLADIRMRCVRIDTTGNTLETYEILTNEILYDPLKKRIDHVMIDDSGSFDRKAYEEFITNTPMKTVAKIDSRYRSEIHFSLNSSGQIVIKRKGEALGRKFIELDSIKRTEVLEAIDGMFNDFNTATCDPIVKYLNPEDVKKGLTLDFECRYPYVGKIDYIPYWKTYELVKPIIDPTVPFEKWGLNYNSSEENQKFDIVSTEETWSKFVKDSATDIRYIRANGRNLSRTIFKFKQNLKDMGNLEEISLVSAENDDKYLNEFKEDLEKSSINVNVSLSLYPDEVEEKVIIIETISGYQIAYLEDYSIPFNELYLKFLNGEQTEAYDWCKNTFDKYRQRSKIIYSHSPITDGI